MIGRKNAILQREQGDAKLTIMIQPAAAGSVVKVFTEGLDWSGDDATPPASKKPTDAATTIEDAAEAQRLLKDALKNLPKGF